LDEVPETFINRFGAEIVETVSKAKEAPPESQDDLTVSGPLTGKEKEMLGRLKKALTRQAEAIGIAPGFLAPRRELEQLVRGDHDVPATRGWRRDVIGMLLLAELEKN